MKQKTHKILIFFTVFLLSISLLSLIYPAKATNYEWLGNADFDDCLGNAVINYGFETGDTTDWDIANGAGVTSVYPYSGTYCYIFSSTSQLVQQIFDEPIRVGEIAYCYVKARGNVSSGSGVQMKWYYNTTGWKIVINSGVMSGTSYVQQNASYSDVDVNLFVNKIEIIYSFKAYDSFLFIDNVVLMRLGGDGQTTIDTSSTPWYSGSGFHGINTLDSYSGGACAYLGYGIFSNNKIVQDINFLDSNKIVNFDMMIKTDNSSSTVFKVVFVYSDRTTSTLLSNALTSASGWVNWDASSAILTNKMLIQVQIGVLSGAEACYVYVDSCNLEASVISSQSRFSWSITPSPVSSSTFDFSAYQANNYTLICYVYDNNGACTENGTYILQSVYDVEMGEIIGGVFTVSLSARPSQATFEEQIIISISVPSGTFVIQLTATWIFNYEGDGGTDTILLQGIIQVIIIMVLIFIPAGVGYYLMGSWGAFFGVNLGIVLGYWLLPSYMPLFAVVVIVIVDALLLFGKVGFGREK